MNFQKNICVLWEYSLDSRMNLFGLIRGYPSPLWHLPLAYLLLLEVEPYTCHQTICNQNHIICYQSFSSWYKFYLSFSFVFLFFHILFSAVFVRAISLFNLFLFVLSIHCFFSGFVSTFFCLLSLYFCALGILSQPTLRRERDAWLAGACSKKGMCAESPPTFFRGKRQKNRKRRGLRTLSERFGSCIYARGRY